ncbi:MAG: hypothetical protein EKK53_07210 [Burkholderiales bacterium]|nr:MAG: hypothetical protein EKK53_07210 [Burkholderiales bacterium]
MTRSTPPQRPAGRRAPLGVQPSRAHGSASAVFAGFVPAATGRFDRPQRPVTVWFALQAMQAYAEVTRLAVSRVVETPCEPGSDPPVP